MFILSLIDTDAKVVLVSETSLGGIAFLTRQSSFVVPRSNTQVKNIVQATKQEILNDFQDITNLQSKNRVPISPNFFSDRRKILMGKEDFLTCDRRFVRQNTH